MERPENIINPKDYDKPHSFEKDWDAEIFYSYIDAQKYIDYLECEIKRIRENSKSEIDKAKNIAYRKGKTEGYFEGHNI